MAGPDPSVDFPQPDSSNPSVSTNTSTGKHSMLTRVLAQLGMNMLQGVGNSLWAHMAPQAFQQHEEDLRQHAQLAQQLQLHNTISPYEQAQLQMQAQTQRRLQEAQDQAQEQYEQTQKDKVAQLLMLHPELHVASAQEMQPQIGMQMQHGQQTPPQQTGPGLPPDMAQLLNLPQAQTQFNPTVQQPPQTVEFGGQQIVTPPQRMFTPPKGSILEKLLGPQQQPLDKLSEPLIGLYEREQGRVDEAAAAQQGLAATELQANALLPKIAAEDPDMAAVFQARIFNAKHAGSPKQGGTDMNQVIRDMGSYISEKSPTAKKEKRDEALKDKEVFATFAANLAKSMKEGPAPDPEQIKNAVDMSLMNPDNFDFLQKTMGKQSSFMKAMGDEFLSRGVNFEKESAQVRESRDYAKIAQPLINTLLTKIDATDKQGKLGPLASRYEAFMQGKVGSGDPEYSQLAGEVDLLRKLVGKIHLGTRGAGSPQNAEAMKQKVDEGKMDAATLKAGLKAYKTLVDLYAKGGMRTREEVQGAGGTPDDPGGIAGFLPKK